MKILLLVSLIGAAIGQQLARGDQADDLANKLFPDFAQATDCGLTFAGLGFQIQDSVPEVLRAEVVADILGRGIRERSPTVVLNTLAMFGVMRFKARVWNGRIEAMLLSSAKSPNEKIRRQVAGALRGFPDSAIPKFEAILAHDSSRDVRESLESSQREIADEKAGAAR